MSLNIKTLKCHYKSNLSPKKTLTYLMQLGDKAYILCVLVKSRNVSYINNIIIFMYEGTM